MAASKTKAEFGPFGEALYPNAKEELHMDVMVRYRTTDEFEKVADYYEGIYGAVKHLIISRGEEDGQPNFCVAAGPKASDLHFSVIMVMPDPEAAKQGKNDLWILALGRA